MAAPKTSINPKARPRTKTKEKTLRGRPVWIDHTGEVTGEKGTRYSEISTTIPWGTEWITAPSVDENGKRLSDDEVKQKLIDTLGKDFITGEKLPTFSNQEKAVEYAQWRSDTMFDQEAIEQGFPEEFPMGPEPKRKDFIDRSIDKGKDFLDYLTTPSKHGVFNKGGAVMNEQMEMAFMQEGGLKDDGMRQDPVSGNEVPNGSMAKEVRDDIPAQLSEGEYVVPADVVRFFGVKFFEDLRTEAKMGLQSMEANGRIGGEPVSMETDELSDEEFARLLQQELGRTLTTQNAAPIQASGGTYVAGQSSDFNPSNFGLGFSMTPGYTPPSPVVGTEPVVETEASCAARGMIYNPETKMCEMSLPAFKTDEDGGREDEGEDSTTWMDSYDYTDFNNLAQQTSAALDGPTTMLGSVAEFILGEGVLGKFAKASNAAQVAANIAILEAQGKDVNALKVKFSNYVNSNGLDKLKPFITGSQLAKQINTTQVDAGLFKDSTDVFGNKIFKTDKDWEKQLKKNAPEGMTYDPTVTTPVDHDDDDGTPPVIVTGGYTRPGSAAPDTSLRPPSKPSGSSSNSSSSSDSGGAPVGSQPANNVSINNNDPSAAQQAADTYAGGDTQGGEFGGTTKSKEQKTSESMPSWFNKGGLASRPKKKK